MGRSALHVLTSVSSSRQAHLYTKGSGKRRSPSFLWVRVGETKVPSRTLIIGITAGRHERTPLHPGRFSRAPLFRTVIVVHQSHGVGALRNDEGKGAPTRRGRGRARLFDRSSEPGRRRRPRRSSRSPARRRSTRATRRHTRSALRTAPTQMPRVDVRAKAVRLIQPTSRSRPQTLTVPKAGAQPSRFRPSRTRLDEPTSRSRSSSPTRPATIRRWREDDHDRRRRHAGARDQWRVRERG